MSMRRTREARRPPRKIGLRTRPTSPAATAAADGKMRGDPAFPNFKLADSPLYRIVRTAGRYTLDMENGLKSSGMDLMSWRALMIVDERSPSSVSEIAERSVTRLSTMTRVVQRLEKKRFVRLESRPTDARVTDVHLTPHGKNAVEAVRGVASGLYKKALGGISPSEVAVLNALMQRIFANLSSSSIQE